MLQVLFNEENAHQLVRLSGSFPLFYHVSNIENFVLGNCRFELKGCLFISLKNTSIKALMLQILQWEIDDEIVRAHTLIHNVGCRCRDGTIHGCHELSFPLYKMLQSSRDLNMGPLK